MIHKQQMGHKVEDIIAGLCEALVRNYRINVAKGTSVHRWSSARGGGQCRIRVAFEKAPRGAGDRSLSLSMLWALREPRLFAQETVADGRPSQFKDLMSRQRLCYQQLCLSGLPQPLQVVQVIEEGEVVGRWGTGGKWSACDCPTR